jgi:protein O-mannosyl-transferase
MSNRKKSSNKHIHKVGTESSVLSTLLLSVPAGVALIIVVAFLAYLPCINGGFVLDDDELITGSDLIKAPDGLYSFWCTTKATDYWPTTNTSLWIEWRLWKMNPAGYHVTNLILHIVESLLIWLILRKLSIPGAFLAAMIFVVHPVNVESVAWIAQRKNAMAMLFMLLSILWYLRAEMQLHGQNAINRLGIVCWYGLSLGAFLLAMTSKGSVAVLPALLLVIVCWLRPLTRWDIVRITPFILVAAALAEVNIWFQTHGSGEAIRSAGFSERLLGAGGVVWFYLYKALLPLDLAFVYRQWDIQTGNLLWWLPLLAVLAVTAMLLLYRKGWSRPVLFAWGFFCVSLTPVMGFADVGFMKHALVADHYQHVAIIGVIALAAASFSAWRELIPTAARWAATAVAIAVVGALAFLTWQQSGIYCNAITLYQATLEKNKDCWMAYNNLGNELYKAGNRQEAIEHYERALALKPKYFDACNNLGMLLVLIGRPDGAITYSKQAVALRPDHIEANYTLGNAFKDAGQYQQAIEQYENVLALKPDYNEARNNLGLMLVKAGRSEDAIDQYLKAIRLNPDYFEAQYNLGLALFQTNRPEEAIEHFKQALRMKPNLAEVHEIMGAALIQMGRIQEGIDQCREALRLKPDLVEVRNNLGVALLRIGRPAEAVENYQQILALKPDFSEGYFNLALALAEIHKSAEATDSAEKALKLAQYKNQTELARRIENWLKSYRASLPDQPNTAE